MLAISSRGIDVTELQKNLTALGYNPGPIDGDFGNKTEEAVKKFQSKNGLKVDGIVGPKTEVKLREIIKKLNSKTIKKELYGFIICEDMGHGGEDPGAVDPVNIKEKDKINTEEKDIALSVGLKLQKELVAKGAKVTVTRGKDEYPSLQKRCDIANNFKADVFISIHCNSGPATASGIETLYMSDKSKKLAGCVQAELITATKAKDRGVKYRPDLYVLKHTNMPAILIEMGFITNPAEEKKLNDPAYQTMIVNAIVKGIIRYKKQK